MVFLQKDRDVEVMDLLFSLDELYLVLNPSPRMKNSLGRCFYDGIRAHATAALADIERARCAYSSSAACGQSD